MLEIQFIHQYAYLRRQWVFQYSCCDPQNWLKLNSLPKSTGWSHQKSSLSFYKYTSQVYSFDSAKVFHIPRFWERWGTGKTSRMQRLVALCCSYRSEKRRKHLFWKWWLNSILSLSLSFVSDSHERCAALSCPVHHCKKCRQIQQQLLTGEDEELSETWTLLKLNIWALCIRANRQVLTLLVKINILRHFI